MADTKRRKTVSVSFEDNGDAKLSFHTAPDANGNQAVAETVELPASAIHDSLINTFALRGVINTFSNIYNRLENPSASDLRREYDKFLATVTDGTWTPGRMADADPDDMILALVEASGQPVHVVQKTIDDLLDEPKRDTAGTPLRDKKNRIMHVHTKAKLYERLSNDNPTVKAALSKIVAERARRLAAEAKSSKSTGSSLADLFGSPAPAQAAQ